MSVRPDWLIKKAPSENTILEMNSLFEGLSLHTVCESAVCPNRGECFSSRTATFLLMGDTCTRNCRFCAIMKGNPLPLDPDEPSHVTQAVTKLGLKHVVLTSVTRDDLADGGAAHFVSVANVIKETNSHTTVEVLIPDFGGLPTALKLIADSCIDVVGHNVETVPRLYDSVRSGADYARSLNVLRMIKSMNGSKFTKSGLMLGLGESSSEVISVMADLQMADCDFLTVGQYLAPSAAHHPVLNYVTPEEFTEYQRLGEKMGFSAVASGPFVRSSFKAAEMIAVSGYSMMQN